MRTAILTVGTRAAGKTTFCEQALKVDSSLTLLSRDNLMVELFGKTHLDKYSGGHGQVFEKMWALAREHFEERPQHILILDTWNGDRGTRKGLIRELREMGAERVVAWYFVTPVEAVAEWFWKKPDVIKSSEARGQDIGKRAIYSDTAPIHDHDLYTSLAAGIDEDGFDEVVRINPLTTTPEGLLIPQGKLEF